jgi:hypothetical protein
MERYRIISGLIISTLFTAALSAQDNNCNFRKSFPVKTGNALILSNKYGDVSVITGKEDSIIICSTVTIIQEDKSLLKKSMKMVTVKIEKLNDTINVATVYDKKFFNEPDRAEQVLVLITLLKCRFSWTSASPTNLAMFL